jgi:hypothetical protein
VGGFVRGYKGVKLLSSIWIKYVSIASFKMESPTMRQRRRRRAVRDIVNSMIEDHNDFDYAVVRAELISMPSASVALKKTVYGGYYYESCRVATSLMIEVIDAETPFANLNTFMVSQLKSALQMTDIGSYWGSMSGVLFGSMAARASYIFTVRTQLDKAKETEG